MLVARLLGCFETVQSQAPLQGNDRALDWLQETERQDERGRQPQHQVHPVGRRIVGLHRQHGWDQHVSDDQDHDVGREIVGAMMMQLLAARIAAILHLEKGSEHPALAAAGTAAAQPVPDFSPERP